MAFGVFKMFVVLLCLLSVPQWLSINQVKKHVQYLADQIKLKEVDIAKLVNLEREPLKPVNDVLVKLNELIYQFKRLSNNQVMMRIEQCSSSFGCEISLRFVSLNGTFIDQLKAIRFIDQLRDDFPIELGIISFLDNQIYLKANVYGKKEG